MPSRRFRRRTQFRSTAHPQHRRSAAPHTRRTPRSDRFHRFRKPHAAPPGYFCGKPIDHAKIPVSLRPGRHDTRRLRENLQTLTCDLTRYRTQLDEEIVSSRTLRLRCTEFEQLHAEDADRIRRLGIRLRRLEASARTVAATSLDARAPLRDTVVRCIRDTVVRHDTVRLFRWRDRWVAVEGRIPRRVLFIRWGTKALRQEIRSANPHTRIVHAEYVKIER